MNHILEADGIQLEFGERKILSDIYIKSETGKVSGLLGRNGEGKTCLLQTIYGILPIEKSVRINQVSQPQAFTHPSLLLYLPQFHFIPANRRLNSIFKDFQIDFGQFENWFPEFINRGTDAIGSLSGGGRRLVEVYAIIKARSLFALLDEPFTHLSPLQTEKIKELITAEKHHKGMIITDHLFRHVIEIMDHLYVLSKGKIYAIKHLEDIERLGYARV